MVHRCTVPRSCDFGGFCPGRAGGSAAALPGPRGGDALPGEVQGEGAQPGQRRQLGEGHRPAVGVGPGQRVGGMSSGTNDPRDRRGKSVTAA